MHILAEIVRRLIIQLHERKYCEIVTRIVALNIRLNQIFTERKLFSTSSYIKQNLIQL